MTLQEFTSQIQGKIFVELNGEAVSSFTSLIPAAEGGEGEAIRNAATNAGVIVFLSSIHKIFAKGMYYGCDSEAFDEAITNISNLQSSIGTLGETISALNDTVTSQGQDITNLNTWTTEKATIIANNVEQIGVLSNTISQLEDEIGDLDSSNKILMAIDGRINTLLGFDKRNNENPNDLDYTWDDTVQGGTFTEIVKNLKTAVEDFSTSLDLKADKVDFNTLAVKIGAGGKDDKLPWWSDNQDDPHKTVVTIVNENYNSIQNLKTEVSGIPKFSIRVVDTLPVETAENLISRSTIFLVRKQDQNDQQEQEGEQTENREMFEEYIWVNKNAAIQGAQENWGWERLGSQFFNIESYVDQETLDGITADLEQRISDIVEQIGNESLASVNSRLTTAEGNITTLQTTCSLLADELHTLIENGEFILTGEDIKTTASGNNTIAQDIADLQETKLDKTALNWVIIGESE